MTAIRTGVLLLVVAGFTLAIFNLPAMQPPAFVIPAYSTPVPDSQPVIESDFMSGELTREVHSATVVELDNGDIRVFWYGGKREVLALLAALTNA